MNKVGFNDKKAIFVDYFDTLVFRRVNSYDVGLRWAYVLKNKYPELERFSVQEIMDYRKSVTYKLKDEYEEIPYNILLEDIYKHYHINDDLDSFINNSFEIELSIENGVQYLNKKLYKFLLKEKKKGKKIYLISDFYLSKEAYKCFFRHLKIDDLFDDIFISVDVNKTKRRQDNGLLYQYALKKLKLNPSEVVMIGDNKYSDYEVPIKLGIEAIFYKRVIKTKKRDYLSYSNKIIKYKDKEWKKSLYLEYSYFFFVFIDRLYNKAISDGVKKLVFLSREGLALKKMFDIYQNILVSKDNSIETYYIYNSRKLNAMVKEEIKEKGYSYYLDYLKDFYDNGYLNMVDAGWNNSAQESIGKYANVKTRGYYIGTFSKKKLNYECDRLGLIYDIKEDGSVSDYYWSLRTNFTLIEQLLAANHGSVINYDNKKFSFEWPTKEEEYYNKYICNLQKDILSFFAQLCVWNNDKIRNISNKELARRNVRTGLFASNERINFLIDSDNSYYDNFSNNTFNGKFLGNKASFKDKIFHLEKRLSIYVKKQRRMKQTKLNKVKYFIFSIGLYSYLRLFKKI